MPFTGRIGTDNSQLGNIVLGIVDSFELSSISFRAHVITSRKLRIIFDHAVSDSALNTAAYVFSSITPPSTPIPVVESVHFEDPNQFIIIIEFIDVLLYQAIYSVQVSGVVDLQGQGISGTAYNFTSNTQDPPIALRAFLSIRGCIDIKFDRSIGPYSNSAIAEIRDSNLSPPGVALVPTTWSTQSIPEDTIRFIYPVTTPTADSYNVDFVGILDAVGNSSSDTIPVTINFVGPYNSSSLSQLQFLDSYVVDVSKDIALGTVRIFFSGPVLNSSAINQASWNLEQSGPHLNGDIINQVSASDALDLTTSITLINQIKAKLNSHIIQDAVHVQFDVQNIILTANATDLPSSLTLYSDLLVKFDSHIIKISSHSYDDSLNLAVNLATDLLSLITGLNDIKSKFNDHILEWKPLQFASGLPLEIGTIENHASTITAFPVESSLSYFVDLHVRTHTSTPIIRVRATIVSEDGGSSTSTLNPTGDITARSGVSPANLIEKFVIPDDLILINFSRDIILPTASLNVNLPSGSDSKTNFELSSTTPWLYRAFNFLVYAYAYHISPNGAGHIVPETFAFVSPGDYCIATDLNSLIYKANSFRQKIIYHILNTQSHYSSSILQAYPEAIDFDSVHFLITRMISDFVFHNSSGYSPNSLNLFVVNPTNFGIHNYPGPNILNSRTFNQLKMRFKGMLNGSEHSINGSIFDMKWDPKNSIFISSDLQITEIFTGIAYRPSLAAAVAISGLVRIEDGTEAGLTNLTPDFIEVFFSKPMVHVELNASNLSIAGGSIVTNDRIWVSPTQANLLVSSMGAESYIISAASLKDEAGNSIY